MKASEVTASSVKVSWGGILMAENLRRNARGFNKSLEDKRVGTSLGRH